MSETAHRARGTVVPFRYFVPAKRRATQYEEVTLHVQWDPKNYAAQGWFNRDSNGRPSWDEQSTALKATDWWAYRDPQEEWFRPYVTRQAAIGGGIERTIASARRSELFSGMTPLWREFLAGHYAAYRFPEYGLFMALCYAQREALSDVVACPLVFQGLEKDRHAQDIALYCMELEGAVEGFSDARCKDLWIRSPVWQPARMFIEQLLACRDWGEINFAINLIYEPLIAALFNTEFVLRFAPRHGDAITSAVTEGAESDREIRRNAAAEFVRFLLAQDPDNRSVMETWIAKWAPQARVAMNALAPLFESVEVRVQSFVTAHDRVFSDWRHLLAESGLNTSRGEPA
jgi:hypothetical protein